VSGNGHADEMLWGFYVGATASWQFSPHWSAVAAVQYQDLQDFNHSFGGRPVEVKLSESIFVTVGVGWNF
jgi:outer membrane scaffolding protein for murein synthesis (MipA/OmpV family)